MSLDCFGLKNSLAMTRGRLLHCVRNDKTAMTCEIADKKYYGLDMSIFALVDCNNFYVSCERAFNPSIEKKPVVVLSNNDGCIISRSNEAKALGIPMGAPFFKWQRFLKQHQVHVFSSNYELYGDMSHRVMRLLRNFCPEMEVYSIDEAFLALDKFKPEQLTKEMLTLKKHIKQCTGIPISIGWSSTKTLAKIANYIAKKQTASGIFELKNNMDDVLASFPAENIWGIGYRLTKRLKELHIHTAADFKSADPKMIRMHFSVVAEKIVNELRGTSCIPMELIQPRKQIICSRSFGHAINTLIEAEEAISHYTAIATKKLRAQQSVTAAVSVFIETNHFQKNSPQYSNSIVYPFPSPTADSRYIIRIAKQCLQHIFKKEFKYHKAGVMLLDLQPQTMHQHDMLALGDEKKSETLMQAIDEINTILGKNTIFYGAEGIARTWQLKSELRSPRYTTKWKELMRI